MFTPPCKRMIAASPPHMIERGSGCILNTASAAGLKGLGSLASYVAAKHLAGVPDPGAEAVALLFEGLATA